MVYEPGAENKDKDFKDLSDDLLDLAPRELGHAQEPRSASEEEGLEASLPRPEGSDNNPERADQNNPEGLDAEK